jgi:uncharacterized protein YjbJ (UPF0337 family)
MRHRKHFCPSIPLPAVTNVHRGVSAADILEERGTMKESTKDQVKGKMHEIKGSMKKTTGKMTNRPDVEAEGQSEKIAGKVQKKAGQIKKVFNQ